MEAEKWGRWKKFHLFTGENDPVKIKIIADVGKEGLLVECPTTAESMGSGHRWEGSAWLML